jgi:cytochrome c-type biogenesis protein CcmE
VKAKGNLRLLVGGAAILGFLVFGLLSFQKSLTPYVGFAEARASGKVVQVKGILVDKQTTYDPENQTFGFLLDDERGERMRVLYKGVRPGNFDQATSIVAIGSYDGAVFRADQLLVKCPSKYQGVEGEDRAYGSETEAKPGGGT